MDARFIATSIWNMGTAPVLEPDCPDGHDHINKTPTGHKCPVCGWITTDNDDREVE